MGTVRFFLNGKLHEVADPDPTRTLLQHLREDLHLTGTKEGCAEGDCGACTVAVADSEGGYRAINGCIAFLPTLDGKDVVTVEGLRGPDGALHPVQRAMVESHGSQCGFCTPGIVMSLFVHRENRGATDPSSLAEALAGNLCRCTGYGPILEAARRSATDAPADTGGAQRRLAEARSAKMLSLTYTCPHTGAVRRYFAPRTMRELASVLAKHPAPVFLAGGTDVGLRVTKQHRPLETIVYLGELAAIRKLVERKDCIEIGAGVTYSEAIGLLAKRYPSFGELLVRLGSVQIRNSGTIGGNIANGSPIGDSPPLLIALGAEIELTDGRNARRMRLEDFFLDYGKQDRRPNEIVSSILVPRHAKGHLFRAYKISKRFDQDISALCGAFFLRFEDGLVRDARIAFGGMAATPRRARGCEAALIGRPWSEATVEAAQFALDEDFAPISDLRASAAYRRTVARNLLRRLWLEAVTPAKPARIVPVASESCHAR